MLSNALFVFFPAKVRMSEKKQLLLKTDIRNRRYKNSFLRSSKKNGFTFSGCFWVSASEFNLLFLLITFLS